MFPCTGLHLEEDSPPQSCSVHGCLSDPPSSRHHHQVHCFIILTSHITYHTSHHISHITPTVFAEETHYTNTFTCGQTPSLWRRVSILPSRWRPGWDTFTLAASSTKACTHAMCFWTRTRWSSPTLDSPVSVTASVSRESYMVCPRPVVTCACLSSSQTKTLPFLCNCPPHKTVLPGPRAGA